MNYWPTLRDHVYNVSLQIMHCQYYSLHCTVRMADLKL